MSDVGATQERHAVTPSPWLNRESTLSAKQLLRQQLRVRQKVIQVGGAIYDCRDGLDDAPGPVSTERTAHSNVCLHPAQSLLDSWQGEALLGC